MFSKYDFFNCAKGNCRRTSVDDGCEMRIERPLNRGRSSKYFLKVVLEVYKPRKKKKKIR